jgi:hypothetical protein
MPRKLIPALLFILTLQTLLSPTHQFYSYLPSLPSLPKPHRTNPYKEMALDMRNKYSNILTKLMNFLRDLGDSKCAYRLEEFGVRAFLKNRDVVDKSIVHFSGNFPNKAGYYQRCIDSPYNMNYYMMNIGSSDLRIGMGFCLPEECAQADMDKVQQFLLNVTGDLIAAHLITYKIPIAALYPYENVIFIRYHKDDPYVSHFGGFSIALGVVTLIMGVLGVVACWKSQASGGKFEVLFGALLRKKSLGGDKEEVAQGTGKEIPRQNAANEELFSDEADGQEENEIFESKVRQEPLADGQKEVETVGRGFWDCFDPKLNMTLLRSRKNWSAIEVAIDVARVAGIFFVVAIRTMIYKLVTSQDILDIN